MRTPPFAKTLPPFNKPPFDDLWHIPLSSVSIREPWALTGAKPNLETCMHQWVGSMDTIPMIKEDYATLNMSTSEWKSLSSNSKDSEHGLNTWKTLKLKRHMHVEILTLMSENTLRMTRTPWACTYMTWILSGVPTRWSVHKLRPWTSEDLTQAVSLFQGMAFPGP